MTARAAAPSTPRKVVVIGGGLAGITAALRCADAGCEVTLLEARPKLGGLTHSFRRHGLDVDNGQHVFMRCCTSYLGLLDRLGVGGLIALQPRLDVPVVDAATGRSGRLRRDELPAPLHLARSLATYRLLSPADRTRAIRGALALRRVDRDAPRSDAVAFGAWLRAHGQTDATVEALWDLVGVATTNLAAREVSLAVAATVFQIGLLTRPDAADLGWSHVPLQQLHGDAALTALTGAGADVRVRVKVDGIASSGAGWVVRAGGEDVAADAVVVATDPAAAERLLPPDALGLPPGWASRLGASPIVNVHLVFDRPVMTEPFLAATRGPVQWVFDRTQQAGLSQGQYVAVSTSAADALVRRSVADIRAEFVPALGRILPAVRSATLLDFFVTREPAATFRATPGSAALRPAAVTRRAGLFVAGAYTATGWPATMESAVRSGEAVAAAVLAATPVGEAVAA